MNDKQKYLSLDNRTGYLEGETTMLTIEELNEVPFNVFMKKSEIIDDKRLIKEKNILKKETSNKEVIKRVPKKKVNNNGKCKSIFS